MAGHEWEDWFEREEFIGQISDIRVQNLQVEREMVQKRTFTRWMNLHLEKCDPPIEVHDLFRDIQDGRILMALLEELSGCKLLHGFKKSSHRIFRLNNIAKVLSFLEERNVKLVSIDATDVADGNSSIILGLIWNIILFFQIKELTGNIRSQFPSCSSLSSIPTSSDSDTSYCSTPSDERQSASTAMREHGKAIKKLLHWVQKRTRKYGVAVQDFGKSWTSGLAFLAVIKSIDPSLVDMRKALLRSARENLDDAFRIAHYSLGIPRLLEPEDVTINAPDEQSIMTYVSQFLEHFPGIEEPEEPCQLIERSVSMGRLNFRDSDSDHVRNGAYKSRVKERSQMFQKDSAKPPPKILISSVSEDRSAMSPPFRPATSRSWSTEDFLADSPHVEDVSSSVVEQSKEPASEVLSNSTFNSPQLSYTHSPTGSSVLEGVNTESVVGDSAISSPDSWVESDFGMMPEKFCESQSDSSLCDSGTAWDVYRATPVEVTTVDEGFVPSIEDRAPDEQSYDEGIYSMSSLERTHKQMQETNLKNHSRVLALEQVLDQSKGEITTEVDSKEINTNLLQKGEVQQEPSVGPCEAEALASFGADILLETDKTDQSQSSSNTEPASADHFEELTKQDSVEESTYREQECLKKTVDFTEDAQDGKEQRNGQTESLNERDNAEEAAVETQCEKTDVSLEDEKEDVEVKSWVLKENDKVVEDKQSEGLINYLDPQESDSTETGGANQGVPGIPLISISSEPEEQNKDTTCDPERQASAGNVEAQEPEAIGSNDTDVNSHQTPHEFSCDSSDNDGKKTVEIPPCLLSGDIKPIASVQIEINHVDDTDEHDIRNMETSEAEQEFDFPHNSQTGNTDEDFAAQTSSTDYTFQPVNTKQDKVGDDFSDSKTTSIQESKSVTSEQNVKGDVSCHEAASVSRHMDLYYTDFEQSSPTEDLIGDPIEPMDLFYPDKEEPMFTQFPDTERQSSPSVLSVSALQPAPASETLLDDLPLNVLGEDLRNGLNLIQETDKVIIETHQENETQEQCLLPGDIVGGLMGDAIPADGSKLSEPEQQSPGFARENTDTVRIDTQKQDEGQIPPVLRHRKGACLTESGDNQRAVTAATRKADNSDFWRRESSELYLLLLLWLLLYCFWVLPQIDLKTLPSLLLNLNH